MRLMGRRFGWSLLILAAAAVLAYQTAGIVLPAIRR